MKGNKTNSLETSESLRTGSWRSSWELEIIGAILVATWLAGMFQLFHAMG
ncbi:hypothetical protein GCM10011349_14560 [Novosphingobium indicum]|uniref:Uncharacterized protein n=1 Tax=Novosphingobium indicum TaxID=462949 RepID=A0ABQ2JG68_9SPHN|nr:hypothetical protein [Novosphingobium indicum]GGN46886.1 hypothetical protein GCM10011349_14560 [Novosphingobium indicum]|tara:strand:+ start:153 stop:302 length:150 start_codon:yes stop_codon:yes gene_type:complete